jgi:LPS O-antigen subunit length determinant protein (WzzB/FepE family)
MNKFKQTNATDEIGLRELFFVLWSSKIFIIFCLIFAIVGASFYLRSSEKKYTVEYKLKPVSEDPQVRNFGGLNGIAAIAGIQLPVRTNTDFKIFKELLTSVEVSERIFKKQKIVKRLFINEWSHSENKYLEPESSKSQEIFGYIKKLIIGENKSSYDSPNPRRLSEILTKTINISENNDTGFIIMKTVTSKPEDIIPLIVEAAEVSDKIMRERYIAFSAEPLAFYKEKLRTSRSREHRESLAQLIAKEEQKLMLASSGTYFVAEPFVRPFISLKPTSPRPIFILLIYMVLGLLFSIIIVLLKHLNKRDYQ